MRTKKTTIGGIAKNKYKYFHKKLKWINGVAKKCESVDCKSLSPKRFEWALRKGCEYSSNVEDYIQLCPSCHRKYDLTDKARENMSIRKQGEKHNHAKLTEEQIVEIVNLIKEGNLQKDVANLFKVDPSTISDIKRGKRWPHLHYLWD